MEEIEIWKDIPEYEGLYQVSNFGRVKSLNYKRSGKEKILKPSKNSGGYLTVGLCKDNKQKSFLLHKLVALTFLKNPYNLPQVNHKDENKYNNRVENLEFCTAKHNSNYGTRNERISKAKKGENHPMYGKQLTEEHKQKISIAHKKPIQQYTKDMTFIKEWDSAKSVSIELNVYEQSITACCRNKQKSAYGFIWRYKL